MEGLDREDGAFVVVPGEELRTVYEPAADDDPNQWLYGG